MREAALSALLAAQNAQPGDPDFLREAQQRRDDARAAIRAQMGPDHQRIMDAIRRELPRHGNIVRDATVPAYIWGNRLLPVLTPRTSLQHDVRGDRPGSAARDRRRRRHRREDRRDPGRRRLHAAHRRTRDRRAVSVADRSCACSTTAATACCARFSACASTAAPPASTSRRPTSCRWRKAWACTPRRCAAPPNSKRRSSAPLRNAGPVLLDIDMNALAPMGDLFGRPRRA